LDQKRENLELSLHRNEEIRIRKEQALATVGGENIYNTLKRIDLD
jgi:hypothetical protein